MPKSKKPVSASTDIPEPELEIGNFADLGLAPGVLQAVIDQGYEQPSPIQSAAIPVLLQGRDLLGQAQTGTGKTAAFALPFLSMIDGSKQHPQLLILAPTRELAIQVAEACQQYAKHLKGVSVLPIYGGQSYTIQLKQLKRGVQVIVGTPGRVMDHMRRGTLSLAGLKALVLDEADEMLRMGFIDDVKWVLENSPPQRQIALFSATMPREVKKVADQHLRDPSYIKIASKTVTGANISQRFWVVRGTHKLDAITRILESEETDGVIVFVRTKNATTELADKLAARGFSCEALNGDVPQANREKIVDKLKKGQIDILIATDVAARGLDVERISHVINYDVPHDTESYVHRIGRTGRAGRNGKAILFIAPREQRMLASIERATNQTIDPMQLPTVKDINESRVARFKNKLSETIANEDLSLFTQIIAELQHDQELSAEHIAAAALFMAQGDTSLILDEQELKANRAFVEEREPSGARFKSDNRDYSSANKAAPSVTATPLNNFPDIEMARYRLDVGSRNRVKPGNIVGAIANEAELESKFIGEIEILEDYSTVDLPADMPKGILAILKKAVVAGRPLDISVYKGDPHDGEVRKDYTAERPKAKQYKPGKKSYDSKRSKSGGIKGTSDFALKKRSERKKPSSK